LLKFVALVALVFCVCDAKRGRIGVDLAKVRRNSVQRRNNVPVNVDFTPAKLPCSFAITETINATSPEFSQQQTNYIFVRGQSINTIYVAEPSFIEQILIRADQRLKDPNTDKVFVAYYAGANDGMTQTENIMLEEQEANNSLHETLEPFEEEWTFINATKGTFHNKNCTIYYTYDPEQEMDVFMFADEENYILGMNYSVASESFFQYNVFDYKFKPSEAEFVLDKYVFGDCNDSRAFVVPKDDPCMAAATATSFVVVLASLAFTLLFLF